MESYSVEAILSARDEGFTSTMKGALGATNSLASKVKSGLGFGMLMGIGQSAIHGITGAVRGLTGGLDAAISRVDTLNNFPNIMKNLGYSAQDAEDAIAILDKGIDGLPTSMDAIVGTTQKIAPLTGSLQDASKVSLALNNALLAGGKSMQTQSNALEQYSQMLAAGKVDMQAWRSMLDAMPGQLDQLSVAILGNGKKQSDLYEAMKSGQVSFEDFNNALLKLNKKGIKGLASFEEQAKTSTQGIGTGIQNLKTAFTKGKANVIKAIDEMLKNNRLPQISGMLGKSKKAVNDFFGSLTGKIKSIDDITGKFKMLGTVLGGLAVSYGALSLAAPLTAAIPAIKTAAAGVVASVAVLGPRIQAALGPVGAIIGNNVAIMQAKFGGIASGIATAFSGASKVAMIGLKALLPAAGIAALIAGLGFLYINFHSEIDKILEMMTTKGPEIIQNLGEGIVSKIPTLMSYGSQVLAKFMDGVTANIPAVLSTATAIITTLVSGLAQNLPMILPSAIAMIGTLVEGLGSALPTLITAGLEVVASLVAGIAQNLPMIIQSAFQMIQNFITGISENLPAIVSAAMLIVVSLIQGLFEAIPALIQGGIQCMMSLIEGIKSVDWLSVGKDILTAIGDGISSGAKGFMGAIKNVLTGKGTDQAASDGGKKNAATFTKSTATNIQSTSGQVNNASKKTATEAVKSFNASTKGIGKELPTEISSCFDKTEALAKPTGVDTGNGYTTGLKGSIGKSSAAAKSTVNKINSTLQSGVGKARSTGAQISAGLAAGMRAGEGAVIASCNRMIAKINEALRKKAEIASPSKMTRRIGLFLAKGIGVGMKAGVSGLKKSSVNLIKKINSMLHKAAKKSTWHKNYLNAANKSVDTLKNKLSSKLSKLTNGFDKKLSKQLEKIRKKVNKKSKGLKKALSNVGKILNKKYSKALTKEMNATVKVASTKLSALGKKYQKKYEAIVSAKNNFVSRMRDYGELFTTDQYGFTKFKDFGAEYDKLKLLSKQLKRLQDLKVSRNFLDQITSMDTASQISYLNALFQKSDKEIKAYAKSFDKYWKKAGTVGSEIYTPYVNKLNKQFEASVKTIMKKLKKEFRSIGNSTALGLASGLKDKKTMKALKAAAGSAANAIIREIRKKLKIHSPSRVMRALGEYTGEGFAEGLEQAKKVVEHTMDGLINMPQMSVPAFSGDVGLSEAYSYGASIEGEIVVPVDLDGREIAQVTAPFTEDILNRRQVRADRKAGRL